MQLHDDLGDLLVDARVFLVSGFNAMRDPELLDDRLATLRRHMRRLPPEAVVYFEDAAYHEPAFSRRVRDALLEFVDVYGLNEDEMQGHLGRTVDLLSPAEVERALRSLHTLIPVPTLVLHTKYWSAAYGRDVGGYASALDQAILAASTRYSHGDDYTDRQYELVRSRPRRPEAMEFAAALQRRMGTAVRCVPGLQLDVARPTTIGLGDTFVGGFLAALVQASSPPLLQRKAG